MVMFEVILLGTFLLGGMRILANDGFTDCPDGWDYNDELNVCYKALFEDLDWYHAAPKCMTLAPGAHLAVILTGEQQDAVAKFLKEKIEEKPEGVRCKSRRDKDGDIHFWTAGMATDWALNKDLKWFWKFDVKTLHIPMRYTNWIPGLPDKSQYEFCVLLNSSVEYKWTNARCDQPLCVLCEL